MARTALYRHFDADGRLLYVGISDCLSARDKQHVATAHWHDQVARTETQWCLSRPHAAALEGIAINFESPAFNIAGTRRGADSPSIPDLLSAIEAHCAKTGTPESTFGTLALGDPNFVKGLKAGREPRRKTVARAIDFILTGKTYAEAKAMADNQSVDVLPDDGSPVGNNDGDCGATVASGENVTPGGAA